MSHNLSVDFKPQIVAIVLALSGMSLSSCGTGVRYEDRNQPILALSDGGASLSATSLPRFEDVAVNASFTLSFSRAVDLSTASISNVYISEVLSSAASSAQSGALTSSLCSRSRAIELEMDFVDTRVVLTPETDMDCEAVYAICVTEGLLILDDLPMVPQAIVFETEDC